MVTDLDERLRDMKPYRLIGGILVSSLIACSGGGDHGHPMTGGSSGSNTGGAHTGGSSPTSGGASGMAGAMMSGGSSGSAGGEVPTGAHCTPGTPRPATQLIGYVVDHCSRESGLTGDFKNNLDIALPKPIGPGDTFAFSVNMNASEGDFEVYGATRECGDLGEKLGTAHAVGSSIICYDIKPTSGTYSHLIWIWRSVAEMKDIALCESGMCPAP